MKNDINRLRLTLSEKRLSRLIQDVQKKLDACPGVDAFCTEDLENFKKQIEFMRMYAFAEKKDPYRQQVFDDIVSGLMRLSRDIDKCTRIELDVELRSMKKRAPEGNFEMPSIRKNLEDYVSSVAMASITGEDEDLIIEKHFKYIKTLFAYIVTGRLWNEAKKNFFSQMLSSPVIDLNDAQVLVSAITISSLMENDEYKVEALMDIYQTASNSEVKNRALVGWILTLHAMKGVCERLSKRALEMVKNTEVGEDVLETQIQIMLCSQAEKDTDTIKRDIIPGVVNSTEFKKTRFGVLDFSEDDIEDIVNNNFEKDGELEQLEKSLDKMKAMELMGSDVYFLGFSMMKKFGFFYSMENWFYPYYAKHPGLTSALSGLKGSKFLDALAKYPFCDSDKYSFAFVLASSAGSLPEDMKMALNEQDHIAEAYGKVNFTSSYKRRMYLQDLFRFFKLNASAKYMFNPYEENNGLIRGFFFDDDFLYTEATVEFKVLLAQFLLKKRPEGAELDLLFDSYESDEASDKLTRANYFMRLKDRAGANRALELYRELYATDDQNETVIRGLFKTLMFLGRYDEAAVYSEELLSRHPDEKKHLLNHAVVLLKLMKEEEADKILFRLNYEYPDDKNVMRILAWCLMYEGKTDKAESLFLKITEGSKAQPEDNFNVGISKWILGKDREAADYFSLYAKNKNLHELTHEIDNERELLKKRGIEEVDMCMMLDLVEELTKQA